MLATLKRTAAYLRHGNQQKLDEVLSEIRSIEAKRQQIEKEMGRKSSVTYFTEKLQAAERRYLENGSDENLEAVLLAELVAQQARSRSFMQNKINEWNNSEQQIRAQFPNWKNLLLKACDLRLAIAEGQLERTTTQERERLGNDFEVEEIEQSPLVRRAHSAVRHWRTLRETIERDESETCWAHSVATVLS
jgi:hypothetical protein